MCSSHMISTGQYGPKSQGDVCCFPPLKFCCWARIHGLVSVSLSLCQPHTQSSILAALLRCCLQGRTTKPQPHFPPSLTPSSRHTGKAPPSPISSLSFSFSPPLSFHLFIFLLQQVLSHSIPFLSLSTVRLPQLILFSVAPSGFKIAATIYALQIAL